MLKGLNLAALQEVTTLEFSRADRTLKLVNKDRVFIAVTQDDDKSTFSEDWLQTLAKIMSAVTGYQFRAQPDKSGDYVRYVRTEIPFVAQQDQN